MVVLAKAPRPGLCKTRLEPLLGRDGTARLQAVLLRRAAAWAAEVGTAYVAYTPDDAAGEIAELAPGARLITQVEGDLGARIAAAIAAALEDHGGPVLLIGVDAPQLTAAHAEMALGDLRSGCDVTFGAATDGGWYLVGVRERNDQVFALPSDAWGGPDVLRLSLEAAARAGLELGMLRAERDLDEPDDVRALLIDPLAPEEVVAALRG